MNWLFPLYLAGAAAIVVPILLHLRRRPPKDRVVFSSLMFVGKSPQRLTRRSKIERWLLLALRCLALIFLALMFARPFFRGGLGDEIAGEGKAVAILVDRSASMRRGDMWKEALDAAAREIKEVSPRDWLAVGVFDADTQLISGGAGSDSATTGATAGVTALAQLKQQSPGWSGTDIGKALTTATGWFDQMSSSQRTQLRARQITLITDLQEGSRLDALRGFAWPEDTEVDVQIIEASDPDNFSLSLSAAISETDADLENEPAKGPDGLRVRVTSARDSQLESFSLDWKQDSEGAVTGYLPGGATRVLSAPPRKSETEQGVLTLTGDKWDFDNQVYVAPLNARQVNIAYLSSNPAGQEAASPQYYLSRALQPTPFLKPVIQAAAANVDVTLAGCSIAFVEGNAASAAWIDAVQRWLQDGGLAVYLLARDAKADELQRLSGIEGITVAESKANDYAMLGEVNGNHPLLLPFADSRLRDFTKIRFWRHRVVDLKNAQPQPEILARFDSGDPAWLAWKIGKGTLLVLASGWQPADSQLALSTKFVPLVFGWLDAAGFSHEADPRLTVGDPIRLRGSQPGIQATVTKPDGSAHSLKSAADGILIRADMPGIWAIRQGDGSTHAVAVNLPPEEGRVAPMETIRLADLGVKLASESRAGLTPVERKLEQERLMDTEEEARQHLWFWVLIGLLAALVAETWLASRPPRIQTADAVS